MQYTLRILKKTITFKILKIMSRKLYLILFRGRKLRLSIVSATCLWKVDIACDCTGNYFLYTIFFIKYVKFFYKLCYYLNLKYIYIFYFQGQVEEYNFSVEEYCKLRFLSKIPWLMPHTYLNICISLNHS